MTNRREIGDALIFLTKELGLVVGTGEDAAGNPSLTFNFGSEKAGVGQLVVPRSTVGRLLDLGGADGQRFKEEMEGVRNLILRLVALLEVSFSAIEKGALPTAVAQALLEAHSVLQRKFP